MDGYTEQERVKDKEAIFQLFRKFVEGTIVQGDYNISLETVAEDVVGIGLGEQGYYKSKAEIRKLFAESVKAPAGAKAESTVEYDEVETRIFTPASATIAGKVYITTRINGNTSKSGIMQMASLKKEDGVWLFCLLTVAPLVLTEESIEAYPLAFAEMHKRRADMLNALNKMSVTLLAFDNKPFEEIINNGLSYMTDVVGVDRVTVYRHLGEGIQLKLIYRWYGDIPPPKEELIMLPEIPPIVRWLGILMKNQCINGNVKDMPEDEADFLRSWGAKAIFIVPIFVRGEFWGIISLEDHKNYRYFEEDNLDLLRSAAHLCAGTVVRAEMEREVNDANAKLRDALEQATVASRSKSDFLANMSHEMRTPMNVVVGLTDLLLEEDDPSIDLKQNLKKISTAGNTLLGLINDVLDFSKIEAGRLELMPVQYEVPSLLNDVITLNIMRIEDKPVTFRLDINKELPCFLYGDDLRIKQIINNLLSNAFKYTQDGTVTLGMSCLFESPLNGYGGDVRMSVYVSDTGIGIREEDLKKLFTDYSQVDTRANRSIEGTGLGLSITKMLVEHMNGEISVESEYGKGTTFRFSIRQRYVSDKFIGEETAENLRRLRYADNRKRRHEKLVRPDLSYATVLVVDDMQTNLDVAAGMLKKYKMRVDCATSGQEAISLIKNGEPAYDAVFMDHMMPVMDGVETAEKIRAVGTKYAMTVPIIALTANAIAGNEQMFLSKDFQAFLPKPLNIINLDAVVQRWVRDKAKE